MSVAQICNLVYADLAQGRNRPQMAELEAALAPPDEKQLHIDRMNAQGMAALGGHGGLGPPPRKAKK